MQATLSDKHKQTLKELNLTQGEYERIVKHLGRDPNMNELGMFSVLWSEHCCYKNSKHLLKKLPTKGPRVLQGPGENAGVIDVGEDMAVAFKIESHNHPTAVEPFQGATTGVGGILRDIFTMNARPIANLNSLRFGPINNNGTPQNKHSRHLFTRAVEGIAHYGNCVGVPTVAGEVFFDESYAENPLVNAMAAGMLYGDIMNSGAIGVGNPVLYVGSATGKDGMGGAAFASRELDESSNEDRPAVQVGDPFAEKLLIESCLEVFATGFILSAQDMGAAGLTCSAAEMSVNGGLGMRIDLNKVPAREPNMRAYEYLLSESQERMLMVVDASKQADVIAIFEKWGVPAVVVGEVLPTDAHGGSIEFFHHGEKVVDLPAALLTELAPSYERDDIPTEATTAKATREQASYEGMTDIKAEEIAPTLEKLFSQINIARPIGVFRQYDRHVQNNTLQTSDHNGSGLIRLRREDKTFSNKALTMTVDCNPRYVTLNPREGTKGAVAESVRNLTCMGSEPIAVTNNLNFGNPEKPAIYYQLFEAVEGMKEACLAFETPVTGGNVSLYNEHAGIPIAPAPVIGMVGLLEDHTKTTSPQFKASGDIILHLGTFQPRLGGSEYQKMQTGKSYGEPPSVDLESEKQLSQVVRHLIKGGHLQSAQDVSMGGLLTTLIECSFPTSLQTVPLTFGIKLNTDALKSLPTKDTPESTTRLDTLLFGETHGSYLLTVKPEVLEHVKEHANKAGLDLTQVGTVTNKSMLEVLGQTIDLNPSYNSWQTILDF